MEKFDRHAQLASIADISKFVAGPMFAIGASALIAFFTGAAATMSVAVPITLLAVAGAALATGVVASYKASRMWSDGQFNNYEISAKSTAHHIVQELQTAQTSAVTHHHARSDGKTWQEFVSNTSSGVEQSRGA